jgi:2-oxoglutarate dehydrogenase E1 component
LKTTLNLWREFQGPNAAYVVDLFEQYERDPQLLDETTRAFFNRNQNVIRQMVADDGQVAADTAVTPHIDKIMAAVNLAQAIREFGHLAAQLDPLGGPPPGEPSLELSYHDLTEIDLRQLPASLIGVAIPENRAENGAESGTNALTAIEQLRHIYATTIGCDYDHLRSPDERRWLREMAETRHFRRRRPGR